MKANSCQKQTKTKLSQQLHNKIQFIYATLMKIGYPHLKTGMKQLEEGMAIYFQASDCRLDLIQWMIAVIYPGYRIDEEYRNCYDDDPHLMRVKKYGLILWQLGVMPVTKFTKNLDYVKYVQGLIGYESSVNLIYHLAELAEAKYSANISRIEEVAGDLLGELIRNHGQLVNVDYDPYGVIFPPKYYNNREEDGALVKQMYDQMLEELEKSNSNVQEQGDSGMDQTNRLLEDVDTYKQLFARKYQKLGQAIERTVSKFQPLIPLDNLKQISQLHSGRMLNIPKSLCKKYQTYLSQTQKIIPQQFTKSLRQSFKQIETLIKSINQIQIDDL